MTAFDPDVWRRWTAADWINEAIVQYAKGREAMTTWVNYGKTGANADAIYQAAANNTQRAIAAASIASAKIAHEAASIGMTK